MPLLIFFQDTWTSLNCWLAFHRSVAIHPWICKPSLPHSTASGVRLFSHLTAHFFTCSFAVTLTPQSSSGLVTSREFYLFHVFSFLLLQFLRFSQLPIRAARIPQIVPPACAATVRSGHIHSAGGISSARSSCAFG